MCSRSGMSSRWISPAWSHSSYGCSAGELGLDLLVLDDAVLVGVDEEHPARLEPALAHDRGRVEVEHADLGGQHHEPVVGDPVARGTQAVAVQDRADLRAVGEHHARRAVPRLHQRGVELVEGAALRVHLGVVLPRLGDHHQHRVRQRAAAHVQQLEDLVEGRGVRRAGAADRVEPLEVARDQVGVEQRLTGPHPVAVAHDRVDLAVVGDEPERVRQRPARERVGREPRVDHGHRRRHALVAQVGVDLVELAGRQHALVDERARGERREVDVGLPLGALAQAEGEPLEGHARHPRAGARHEELGERRHHAARGLAERLGVDRYVAPAEDGQALLGRDLLDPAPGLGDLPLVTGEEGGPDGVGELRGQVEVHDLPQERVRNLDQDARAVAGVRLRTRGTAVVQVQQGGDALANDVVAGNAGQGRDERHATSIVLVAGVVEPLGRRECVLNWHRAFSRRRLCRRVPVQAEDTRGRSAVHENCRWGFAGDDIGPSGGLRLPPSPGAGHGLPEARTRDEGPSLRSRRRWNRRPSAPAPRRTPAPRGRGADGR